MLSIQSNINANHETEAITDIVCFLYIINE